MPPCECRYDTASELHRSQGWELIGHFMAVSPSRPLSSEEVSAVIKAPLEREGWPRQQRRGGYKDLLLASTSHSFKSQSSYLMLLCSSNITGGLCVLKEVGHEMFEKRKVLTAMSKVLSLEFANWLSKTFNWSKVLQGFSCKHILINCP